METSKKDKLRQIESKKILFQIEVEVMVPTKMYYFVEAENIDQALQKIKRAPDKIDKPAFNKAKRIKAIVKKKGENMILRSQKL